MYLKNQIFTAPLAGISDKPFRQIIRLFSSDIIFFTEMISSHSLVLKRKNCKRNFDTYFEEKNIHVQIFGSDPLIMTEASKILEDMGASYININMGCPVPKVASKSNAGAYLMKNHKLAESIIKQVKKAIKIPLSVKSRLGWDSLNINWEDLAKICFDNGVSEFFIHGRTRAQGYTGYSNLYKKPDIQMKIIANGDIKDKFDLEKVYNLGYDGAMIGRALLGKPYLIEKIYNDDYEINNIKDVILRHLDLTLSYYGVKIGIPLFRKHAMWYSSGLDNSNNFRIKINQAEDEKMVKRLIKEFFI